MTVAFALRLERWGVIGFALAALVATSLNAFAFYVIAGNTPAERAAFGQSPQRAGEVIACRLAHGVELHGDRVLRPNDHRIPPEG
jgi:hypothetical protein